MALTLSWLPESAGIWPAAAIAMAGIAINASVLWRLALRPRR
jgi:hypothetical protein